MKSVLRTSLRPTLNSLCLLRFSTHASINADQVQHSSPNPTSVHPSAIIQPAALIGQGVSIGPFCTVGSGAKIGDGCRLYPGSHVFGNTELGERCVLMPGAVVGEELPGWTVLGQNNIVGHHAVVGVKCQDMKYKFGDECFLEIGDNNEIREHASIHRSSKPSDRTVIGNNNLIMGSCHIAHDCNIGNHNIFANNTLLAGHVFVEWYIYRTTLILLAPLLFINFAILVPFLSSVVDLWFHKTFQGMPWWLEKEQRCVVLI